MRIAALPTWYAGCIYRSRLEARCAVFFDHLGERFDYEPEGLKIGDKCYLPDFYLPRLNAYFEVKGRWDATLVKPRLLAEALFPDTAVYALIGSLPSYHQMTRCGWWDAERRLGITEMTPAFEWGAWFPADYPPVLEACESARSASFTRPGCIQPRTQPSPTPTSVRRATHLIRFRRSSPVGGYPKRPNLPG